MSDDDFTPDEQSFPDEQDAFDPQPGLPDPPHPINWNLLSSTDLDVVGHDVVDAGVEA